MLQIKIIKTFKVKHIERALNVSKENINDSNEKDILSHNDRIKRAEIKLAAFFAEHNVAFTIADHLIPLLKDICIDPEIVSNLSLARDVNILLQMLSRNVK